MRSRIAFRARRLFPVWVSPPADPKLAALLSMLLLHQKKDETATKDHGSMHGYKRLLECSHVITDAAALASGTRPGRPPCKALCESSKQALSCGPA